MNIRKKFRTIKCLYRWGTIYDPETGEPLKFNANTAYLKTSWAWCMVYQRSENSIPQVIRIIFVDEQDPLLDK